MKKVFTQLFTLFLLSCAPQEKGGLVINNSKCRSVAVQEVFKNWQLIELDYFVSEVEQILIWNDLIFIVDRQLESLKIFNKEGILQKVIEGDIFENGKNIQPVCIYKSHTGNIAFYDAANESFINLDPELNIAEGTASQFYASKIYTTDTGYIVFKNQTVQNREDSVFHSNVLILDQRFNLIDKHFDFSIEKNVPRSWRFFPDPITLRGDGFEFYEPLTANYTYVNTSGTYQEIPIQIEKRALKSEDLLSVDLEDPFEVLENIFKKYAMINSKRLESSTMWGVRFIDNFKSNFYFFDENNATGVCVTEFILEMDNSKLIVPFPSAVDENSWISILDGNNYEVLNLDSYSNIHPVIDDVIKEGKTFILIMEN